MCTCVVGCDCQVDAKVSSKTIQRLQGQVEAKQHELGALNIKVRVRCHTALCLSVVQPQPC